MNLSSLLQHHVDHGGFDGVAAIAWKGGRFVVEQYAGRASPSQGADENVLWPVASISKMYAASTILRLIELGELTLSTRVADVIPEFADAPDGADDTRDAPTAEWRGEVRLRNLLTHSSGLPYEPVDMEARLIAQEPLAALVAQAYREPLGFRPGTTVAYADNNTLLAGEMAARVTGRSFESLVAELTLAPMGLHNTFFPAPAIEDHRIAHVRAVMAEGTLGAMYNSRHARGLAHPAFAVVATARDLVTFWSHFAPSGPRIHRAATVRAMTSNQTGLTTFDLHPGVSVYDAVGRKPWGFGPTLMTEATPGVFAEMASFRTFGHGGASGCISFVDPEHDLVVAVLSNTHLNAGYEQWHRRLLAILNRVYVEATSPAAR